MLVKHGRALERSLMLLDIGEHPQRRHQNALRLLLAHWPTAPALVHCPLARVPLQTDHLPNAAAGRARAAAQRLVPIQRPLRNIRFAIAS
jgi:hypothetical protein